MKEKFIAFLKKHKALTKFKSNLKNVRMSGCTIDRYCDVCFGGINGGFGWSDTPEGFEYWNKLSVLWYEEESK